MPSVSQTTVVAALAFAAGLGARIVLPDGVEPSITGGVGQDGGDGGPKLNSLVWPEVGRPCDGPDADDVSGGMWIESDEIGQQGQSAPICTEAVSATHTGTRP